MSRQSTRIVKIMGDVADAKEVCVNGDLRLAAYLFEMGLIELRERLRDVVEAEKSAK